MANERIYRMLPPGVKREDSCLTTPEVTFLEMYLFTDQFAHDIYKYLFNTKDMSDASIRKNAAKLLQSNDAQVYVEDRMAQIDNFLNKTETAITPDDEDILDENGQFRPEIIRQVMIQAGREFKKKGNVDNRLFEKMFDYIMKNSNISSEAEKPIRVLAEQCHTCRYRIYCEENCDDVCKLCRYQIESETKYDHKTQFIPLK